MAQIRIDKLLTELQIASRSEAKKLVQSGSIQVNGEVIKSSSFKCDPTIDKVVLNGKQITYEEYEYYMLYKPAGCITATKDLHEKIVMDYLPKEIHRNMSPVGRLDKDTEGLLLITNDGELNHNLLAPGKHVEKTYYARIRGTVTQETIELFQTGLNIGEKKETLPAELEILSYPDDTHSDILVTITEGKYHQVKRMFQAVGMEVEYLKRLSMGTLKLDQNLKPGEYRKLTDEEVRLLKTRKRYDAIIFDLDGTLADSMWVWHEIDLEFFEERGMEFPESLNSEIEGMSFTETAEYYVNTYAEDCTVEQLKNSWNQKALEKYQRKVPLKPGALEFLSYIRSLGIKTGIATSNSQFLVDTFLRAQNIEKEIDCITTSCEVQKGKPAPDVYLATAQKLDVKPENCLVFEDIPMGILAGKNAGMKVCAIWDAYSDDQTEEKKRLADDYKNDFFEVMHEWTIDTHKVMNNE